jgi:hypothetical protein
MASGLHKKVGYPPKAVPRLYTRTPPSLVWAETAIRFSFGHISRYEQRPLR